MSLPHDSQINVYVTKVVIHVIFFFLLSDVYSYIRFVFPTKDLAHLAPFISSSKTRGFLVTVLNFDFVNSLFRLFACLLLFKIE